MKKGNTLQTKLYEELLKFQKTTEELNLIKLVSKDLRSYKRMLQLKNND